jgi:hypothetical protein
VTLGFGEPGPVRRLIERPFEPTRYLVPKSLRSQLYRALHAALASPLRFAGAASIAASSKGDNGWKLGMKERGFAALSPVPHDSPQVWRKRFELTHFAALPAGSAVDNSVQERFARLPISTPSFEGISSLSSIS